MGRRELFASLCLVVAAASDADDLRVAPDGSGDFTRIQDAIDAVPHHNDEWVVISIAPGVYTEHLEVPATKGRITLLGSGRSETVVRWDRSDWDSLERWVAEPVFTCRGDDVVVRSLTLHNLAGEPGGSDGKWDAAFMSYGDRLVLADVHLRGDHDTLLVYGAGNRIFVDESRIQGRGDMIASFTTTYIRDSDLERVRDAGHFLYQHSNFATPLSQRDRLVVVGSRFRGQTQDPVWPFGVSNLMDNPVVYLVDNVMDHGLGANRPVVHFHEEDQYQHAWIFHRGNVGRWGDPIWNRFSWVGPAGTPRPEDAIRLNAGGVPFVQELAAWEAEALTPAAVLGGSDGWDPEGASAPTPVWLGGDGSWQDEARWDTGESPDAVRDARIGSGEVTVQGVDARAVDVALGEAGGGTARLVVRWGSLAARDLDVSRGSRLALQDGAQLAARFLRVQGGSLAVLASGSLALEDRMVVSWDSALWLRAGSTLDVDHFTNKGATLHQAGEVEVGGLLDLHAGSYRLLDGALSVDGRTAIGTSSDAPASLAIEGGAARFGGELSLGWHPTQEAALRISGGAVEFAGPLRVGDAGSRGRLAIAGGEAAVEAASYHQGASGVLEVTIDDSGLTPIEVGGDVHFASGARIEVHRAPRARLGSHVVMRWTGERSGAPQLASESNVPSDAILVADGEIRVQVGSPSVPLLPLGLWALAWVPLGLVARRALRRRR